ncbi:MAG: hypothetical protein HRU22_18220 [Gammaproteobacteria bacterium]|nr:hypothetical protein [Gammaproteobacteria bacterium]
MNKDKSNQNQERGSKGGSAGANNRNSRVNQSGRMEYISDSTITAHFSPPKKPTGNDGSKGGK